MEPHIHHGRDIPRVRTEILGKLLRRIILVLELLLEQNNVENPFLEIIH